jgi:hypothetical protein
MNGWISMGPGGNSRVPFGNRYRKCRGESILALDQV